MTPWMPPTRTGTRARAEEKVSTAPASVMSWESSGSASPRSRTTLPLACWLRKRKFDNILLEAMMAMRASWERLSGLDRDGEHQEDL